MNSLKKPSHMLYDPHDVRDACGFGLVASVKGQAQNSILTKAIGALQAMSHRGGVCADGVTGDGCGVLMAKPDAFLRAEAERLFNVTLTPAYAVGTIFLNPDPEMSSTARAVLETELRAVRMRIVGWREVPTNPEVLGPIAKSRLPRFEQVFINAGNMPAARMRARLYMARRRAEQRLQSDPMFYIASLRRRVLLYKGLVTPEHLPLFFTDLQDPRLATSICVFHQRFSTNTLPQWHLAQPFRMLAHNGEINTIEGNRLWAKARQHIAHSSDLPDLPSFQHALEPGRSDSASMDNMLEQLQAGGVDLLRAVRMMVPPAWQNSVDIDRDTRALFEYMSFQMEPWDGPAGLVMTDGRYAVCALDRNGLRPARFTLDKSDVITVASEVGVVANSPDDVKLRGRLGPGDMLAVDIRHGRLLRTAEINRMLASEHPYRRWIKDHSIHLESASGQSSLEGLGDLNDSHREQAFKFYQLTREEEVQVLRPLVERGLEGVGSMGDDTPPAVMSTLVVRPLYDYFRQRFAQVTNPAIDSIRESVAMSLETFLGTQGNPYENQPHHARKIVLQSPLLSPGKYQALQTLEDFTCTRFQLAFKPESTSGTGLRQSIQKLTKDVERAIADGCEIIVLCEPRLHLLQEGYVPLHALLATGALHHHLIQNKQRHAVSIIVETASARDPHQIASLIGFGANAIYPWLAYDCVKQLHDSRVVSSGMARALNNYRRGINKGLLKIMSKMGISTIASYRGAELFEAVGLAPEVSDLCFSEAASPIAGATFADLEEDAIHLHQTATSQQSRQDPGGILKFVLGSEYHCFNPDVVEAIQKAVETGQQGDWESYASLINDRPPTHLRDLLALNKPEGNESITLDSVETAESILPRFDSAGMSLGALSPEAHADLARAMNSLGCRSNSGEGGEDPQRLKSDANSRIKQVASGRFGVTPRYLRSADVIQIKIAQGAKPGEGGQLPGSKVNTLIARLRYSVPGVTLISPPPHHDIYSIEDLAQLIWDLKQVNPQALVSVKLVSSRGIGTIAAGVVKAGADFITVSGYDGGTAASPLSSIRYAGSPWEIGLAEVQQTLCANGLREQVRLQVDGGLKSGLDVIKGGILGADSFGFGTAPMIALGCRYLRICHLNNCATGVATQHDKLRSEFYLGTYGKVRHFFTLLTEEVRQHMAELGVQSFDDLIGQTEYLQPLQERAGRHHHLNLEPLLAQPTPEVPGTENHLPRYVRPRPPPAVCELVQRMMEASHDVVASGFGGGNYNFRISNQDRSVGTRLSGEIADLYGNHGVPGAPISFRFKGTAGQSFGAFNVDKLELRIDGECNDYVGKGMAGGLIVVRPEKSSSLVSHETPIVGNTCLYGATGGELYVAGRAGERFAVRNSGATAVIEGAGQHCCEYMTGGQVVVCGEVGHNFGAGMTGGLAYILDEGNLFVDRCNHEMTAMYRIVTEETEEHRTNLMELLKLHASKTKSDHTRRILEDFDSYVRRFWLVVPRAATIETMLHRVRADAA